DVIERNARLQSRLIDDLLDISRIASGKLRFEPKLTDLNAAVAAAAETVRASASAQRVELAVSLAEQLIIVHAEPVRLQQIVWNLLSNAIKFTEALGRVELRIEAAEDEAHVIVEDTGIGIAPDFLPHVFDRFRQADGTRTRSHGGLGLGLAIVDALVKLHGGHVRAESEGPGRGSRFTFTLPRIKEVTHVGEAQSASVSPMTNQCVLIVDDSPDTLALLQTLFEQKGSRVLCAASGEEALKLVAEQPPSVIISDIGMPGMDGYQLLVELRRLPHIAHVPAVAISGYAMDEDRERALNVGYVAHLPKPIDVDNLFALIREITS